MSFLWGAGESPSAADIKSILEAGGISYEDEMIDRVIERMEGKQAHELISEGFGKFAACGGGGGGGGGGGVVGSLRCSPQRWRFGEL
ncbi:60S acidic ribosomal protein P2 [Symbiodinium microadriaticum]|uniref:60S acidic ribosomal protein P2 n=1 Tax=Symbiodinium microadriaticum TaxID=2951 RepID=A0A1Q9DF72_SYMMI|nr:60S acidic ribosomal protein P2 [Symbiodinium microadriaticum]